MLIINNIASSLKIIVVSISLIQLFNNVSIGQSLSISQDSTHCIKLIAQADSLISLNQFNLAIEKAKQASNISSQNEFQKTLLKSNILLGDAYSAQNQVDLGLRYYLLALSVAEQSKESKQIRNISSKIGDALFNAQVFEKALEYFQKSYDLYSQEKDYESLSLLEDIGLCFRNLEKNSDAIKSFQLILIRTEDKPYSSIRNRAFFNLSEILRDIKNWDEAIMYCQQLYNYSKEKDDQYGMALMMNNIGYNLIYKNEYEKSIEAFKTALTHANNSKISYELPLGILTNLGICYQNISNYKKAREYINQAISIAEKNKDGCRIAYLQNLTALIYYQEKDLYNAHEFSRASIEYAEKSKCKDVLQECFKTFSIILRDGNDYINALTYYEKYLKIRDSVLFEKRLKEQNLSDQLASLKETESKQQLFIADQQMRDLQVKQLKLETEQKEQEISLLKKEKELEQSEKNRVIQSLELSKREHEATLHQSTIRDLEQKNAIKELEIKQREAQEKDRQKEIVLLQGEKERQKLENEKLAEGRKRVTWMLVLSGVIIVLIAISYIVTRKKNYLLAEQKQVIQDKNLYLEQANQDILEKNVILSEQSEEIRAQNEEITTQKEIIEKKNEDITDSILYARVIQSAILPEAEPLQHNFSDHFILYRPKDIVSGDFWWFEKTSETFILAVADCTGHGVPGALLSMLGVAYLHEIVSINSRISASDLLFELRKMIVDSLKSSPTRDGMDIALCIFDFAKGEVEIAAANNPVYILRNNEIEIIKADKMPIGIHPLVDKPYNLNRIKFQKGDKFYLFTDGYADQFGGDEGKKLKISNFRDMLLQSYQMDMTAQMEWLENELATWQGRREQVDDILVIGVTI